MTRDDIVRMAHEAGILMRSHENQDEPTKLERFAALVARHEREQCAQLCEDATASIWDYHPDYANEVGRNVCTNLAEKIRARAGNDRS